MPQSSAAAPTEARRSHSRLRFELIFGSILLGLGLFVLPGLIFWVGKTLLGPYGNGAGAGIGTFYADFYGDLATGSLRAWTLAVGPLVMVLLVRLIFLRRPAEDSGQPDDDAAPRQVRPAASDDHRRIEPRVSLD
ncbi:MAG TPA: hypothetical protein VKB34_03490 [Povalibacter sp.]|nr:hypothetical protein [Povalibacter sp.]